MHVAYTVAPVTIVERKQQQRYPLFPHGINFSNSGLHGSSSCAPSVTLTQLCLYSVFTALHAMQTRYSDEKAVSPSVCSSVRPSVKRVDCDKTEGRSLQIFVPYERSFRVLFWEQEWWWGDPFYLKFWVNKPPLEKIADFEPIVARSTSTVTPSENSSINTNRKSTTRFPMSLRWSPYIKPKPPKTGSKTQNGRFPSEIALRVKKFCYKVSIEKCQRQSCKAFIGLTIRAKIIGGGQPL